MSADVVAERGRPDIVTLYARVTVAPVPLLEPEERTRMGAETDVHSMARLLSSMGETWPRYPAPSSIDPSHTSIVILPCVDEKSLWAGQPG